MGLFPNWGPMAEDSAAKIKRSQLNVCTVYVYCVRCTLSPPLWLKSEPGWPAISVSRYFTTVSCWANSLVWVSVCYFTAS
jgi:hypothetical protein